MSSNHTQLTMTYSHIASKEKLQGTDRNELEVNVVLAQQQYAIKQSVVIVLNHGNIHSL